MTPSTMTDNEIRIAIAFAVGWRWEEPFRKRATNNRLIGPKLETVTVWRDGVIGGSLPDYLTSLDAMAEAEKVLTDEQYKAYGKELMLRAKRDSRTEIEEGRMVISATARQRALAFLATLNP